MEKRYGRLADEALFSGSVPEAFLCSDNFLRNKQPESSAQASLRQSPQTIVSSSYAPS